MVSAVWPSKGGVLAFVITASLALWLSILWRQRIDSIVPASYLDEVFHVRQAQAYWQGRWRQWDPKITTPPGLYVLSYLVMAVGVYIVPSMIDGSTSNFRATNGLVIFNVLQLRLRRLLGHLRRQGGSLKICLWELNWTALNICLFPPIFFFSGLYYTDIAALLFVVEAYWQDVRYDSVPSAWWNLCFIVVGLLSLTFRQTNIIWAVIFIGGLKALRTLKSLSSDCRSSDLSRICKGSWEIHQLYDPPAANASIADYFKFGLSVVISGLLNIVPIINSIIPHLIVLAAFGAFVLWNGSIVLGHKEFHTAQIHLPQVLYIWPYILFFSWPIFIIPFLSWLHAERKARGISSACKVLPSIFTVGVVTIIMGVIVHFNTIIHPFTLADNRHYVFYVFRILMRHPFIKYAVTPLYCFCAWASISTLSGAWTTNLKTEVQRTTSTGTSNQEGKSLDDTVRVSFVVIWLAATTLTLVTAPLVEPRYFIIPWVIWRLHVPPPSIEDKSIAARMLRNVPLLLESVWYVVINIVVGYMFLYQGFEWPQEPGLVQRFMW